MDSFQAPDHHVEAGNVDEDEIPRPGILAWIAAISGVGSGLFGAVYALQLVLFIYFRSSAGYVPYLQFALCGGVLVTAAMATRLRPAVAFAFAGLSAAQLLLALVWTIYLFLQPIVTALGLLWPVMALVTAVLAPAVVPPALKAASYRRRLLDVS